MRSFLVAGMFVLMVLAPCVAAYINPEFRLRLKWRPRSRPADRSPKPPAPEEKRPLSPRP